ncbi:MAG: PH domain-containing protein [Phycisphaerales bacterium]|nr:PH domain-containing protein [Phycisphaerales bacterium]
MSSHTHDTSASGRARRTIGRGFVPGDEAILFDRHPSFWLVFLRAGPVVLSIVALALVVDFLVALARYSLGFDSAASGLLWGWLSWICVGITALAFGWAFLDWLCRRYVLTDRRAIVISGVLHQQMAELPLERVQNVGISKPLVPRLLRLGHVGLASAGTDGYEVVWRALAFPEDGAREIRKAIDAGKARP